MDIVNKITDFINNIKLIFTNSLDFFPSELLVIIIPTFILLIAIFIYRFVR